MLYSTASPRGPVWTFPLRQRPRMLTMLMMRSLLPSHEQFLPREAPGDRAGTTEWSQLQQLHHPHQRQCQPGIKAMRALVADMAEAGAAAVGVVEQAVEDAGTIAKHGIGGQRLSRVSRLRV